MALSLQPSEEPCEDTEGGKLLEAEGREPQPEESALMGQAGGAPAAIRCDMSGVVSPFLFLFLLGLSRVFETSRTIAEWHMLNSNNIPT